MLGRLDSRRAALRLQECAQEHELQLGCMRRGAATLAERLGVNADPFLMAVAVAASCAFMTPIGHQNNALILGPGGYRFGDYWRMGLPLEILVILVGVPAILMTWPL